MSEITVANAANAPVAKSRLVWIDVLKGLAILIVLAHHYMEPGLGFKVLLSSQGLVPSLTRMWEVSLQHSLSGLDTALMVTAGLGYQGVHLFLVASGFSLALASVNRSRSLSYGAFLKRRVARLLPPYWILVLLLGTIGAVMSLTHWKIPWLIGSSKSDLFVNLFLLRNFAEKWIWIYPSPLWFVPLIVQLYLLFPPLMSAMQKRPQSTLIACAVLTVAYRSFAVFVLGGKPVGIEAEGASTPLAFCLARLFEFAFGMWLALHFAQNGHIVVARGSWPCWAV